MFINSTFALYSNLYCSTSANSVSVHKLSLYRQHVRNNNCNTVNRKCSSFSRSFKDSVAEGKIILNSHKSQTVKPFICRTYASESARDVSPTTVYLRNYKTGAEVFLIGTAHVSRSSAEEVRSIIRQVKPQTVMVELCAKRAERMRTQKPVEEFNVGDMLGGFVGALQTGGMVQAGLTLFYSMFKLLGITPGLEFKVAIDEAQVVGAKVVYGDRNIDETTEKLRKALSSMNLMDFLRMSQSNASMHANSMGDLNNIKSMEEFVESMKTREQVREFTRMGELSMPQVIKVMLHERDEFMINNLLKCNGKVVVVVGLAHLDGMQSLWIKNVDK